MRPDQPQGRRARERPSTAEINRRAGEPPRPRHPLLEMDRHRVGHRHAQSLPQQQEHQQRGDRLLQDDPNTYQDGHRRYHSSVTGRTGPYALDDISTSSMHNYHGIPTRAQILEPQYSGTQYPGGSLYSGQRYQGLQFSGSQYTGQQYPGPQYPSQQYPGHQYPGPQYTGTQHLGHQYPSLRYPGPQIQGFDNTYRAAFDEFGIPQVIGDIPRFQEGFGQSSSIFNDQMFAGPPDPQPGIPNSMAPFDNTIFQHGNMNLPYLLPDPRLGNSIQEQEANQDPFQSLLSSPYLLPAPLPSSPIQQQAITQDPYQPPSSGTSHVATTHGQSSSRAARIPEGYLHEYQTTVNPRELNIVQYEPQRSLTRPADQTSNFGERHGARNLQASAVNDQGSNLPNPGLDQQPHTSTRQRVSNYQRGFRHSQGQDSGNRKRRAHSSPPAGSSPEGSSPIISIAGRRQGQNPKTGSRVHFHPEQGEHPPEKTDNSEPQKRTRRLIARLPIQSETLPKRTNRRRALSSPEAGSSPLMTDRERPAKAKGPVPGKVVPNDNHNDDQKETGDDEHQQADDAENPSLPNQHSGSPSRPPRRPSAKKRRSRRNFFADLEACDGVVIPSKLKPGEAPRVIKQSRRNPPDTGGHECPICGERFGLKHHVQQHFAACVNRNGNPDGHHWDDLLEDIADLEACDGVVIPSKLEPGEAPRIVKNSNRKPPPIGGSECPICGERFGLKHHLKEHFAACVNRNGNPDGHYWDDLVSYE